MPDFPHYSFPNLFSFRPGPVIFHVHAYIIKLLLLLFMYYYSYYYQFGLPTPCISAGPASAPV